MTADHVEELRDNGYAIIRGFLEPVEVKAISKAVDEIYAEGMTHHAPYRDRNIAFEVMNDPKAMQRVVTQAYWFAWINPIMEAQRRHRRYLEILQPLIGESIKQIANQIHWKHPGAKYTSYRYHQDMRFRQRPDLFTDLTSSYFTTGLAINRIDADNGALSVFPGSHKLGYLGLADKHERIMQGQSAQSDDEAEAELRAAGLDPKESVVCELEPGDLVMWGLLMVHGSGRNRSDRNRPLVLNSYVRADASPHRGEWAFRDGLSTTLGAEQNICRFEDFDEYPEPFYNETDWTGEQPSLD